jgi:hypothetical protein
MNYKPAPNYPNYIIYENGDIVNKQTQHKLKIQKKKTAIVTLCNNGITKHFNVIRLIYEVFNNVNLDKNECVVFNDGDKNNFHYTNLVIKNETHLIKLDDAKIWKLCVENNNYKISNYGDVFSINTNKILKPYLNVYYLIQLCLDGIQTTYRVHCLVYRAFKGDIPKDRVIDHLDRNKLNNYIDNLQIATRRENAINIDPYIPKLRKVHQFNLNGEFIKEWESLEEINKTLGYKKNCVGDTCLGTYKQMYGFKWTYVDKITDLQYYKTVIVYDDNYKNYMIDTNGNVINRNHILMSPQTDNGYQTIKLTSSLTGKSKRFKIHQLVAMTYLNNPNNLPIINHIDENRSNNDVNNLEWCDQLHNVRHSCGKKVNQINIKDGTIINTFSSLSEASKFLNIKSTSCLSEVCNGNQKTAYGFKWEFAT